MSESGIGLKVRLTYYLIKGMGWLGYLVLFCMVVFKLTAVGLVLVDLGVQTIYINASLTLIFIFYCWIGLLLNRKVIPWSLKIAAKKLATERDKA